jgi:hypothetical protein
MFCSNQGRRSRSHILFSVIINLLEHLYPTVIALDLQSSIEEEEVVFYFILCHINLMMQKYSTFIKQEYHISVYLFLILFLDLSLLFF